MPSSARVLPAPSSVGAHGGPGSVPTRDRLWEVRVKEIWRFLLRQKLSFLFICGYMFFEYVRPQSVYPSIDVLPWAQLMCLGALTALAIEGKTLGLPTFVSWLYVAFIGVVLLSSFTAWDPSLSWALIDLPLSWLFIYLLIVNLVNTERRFFIFMLAFLLYSAKMSQHGARTWASVGFGFQGWGATGAPGWFHNSGEFGIQMCVFLPLSVAFVLALRHRWERWKVWLLALMPITAVMSMVASSSRGALIGGAVLLLWMLLRTRYRVRGTILAIVMAAAVWTVIPAEQKARLDAMGEDDTSVSRLVRWENGIDIANNYPVLGIGYNNWGVYYGKYYGGGPQLSHNIFIQAWAELGYLGLGAFLALIGATFRLNWKTRRIANSLRERGRFLYFMAHGLDGALIGLLASGFFVTVLHYPFFWINLAMTVSLYVSAKHTRRMVRRAPGQSAPAGRQFPMNAGPRSRAAAVATA